MEFYCLLVESGRIVLLHELGQYSKSCYFFGMQNLFLFNKVFIIWNYFTTQIFQIAAHLVYWGKAIIIYPLCENNVYMLSPHANICLYVFVLVASISYFIDAILCLYCSSPMSVLMKVVFLLMTWSEIPQIKLTDISNVCVSFN